MSPRCLFIAALLFALPEVAIASPAESGPWASGGGGAGDLGFAFEADGPGDGLGDLIIQLPWISVAGGYQLAKEFCLGLVWTRTWGFSRPWGQKNHQLRSHDFSLRAEVSPVHRVWLRAALGYVFTDYRLSMQASEISGDFDGWSLQGALAFSLVSRERGRLNAIVAIARAQYSGSDEEAGSLASVTNLMFGFDGVVRFPVPAGQP